MSQCYCGSGRDFTNCCAPVLDGSGPAETAEVLMRARYSAFATQQAEFLHESLHPEHRDDHDLAATRKWAENSQWLGLEIVAVEAGGPDDSEGTVEFVATYKERGLVRPYHEVSNFCKVDDRWYYVDGKLVMPETEVRNQPKVGRNDPCPCGSGKKYKKCCGR
ncbi:MAG: YchJ family metal-binding protein [Pseudomonadota bacterium]